MTSQTITNTIASRGRKVTLCWYHFNEFEVLKETYQEWVDEPAINPDPLPIEYIGEAEPEKLT
jgi:hypothetical protein